VKMPICRPIEDFADFEQDACGWLTKQMSVDMPWLLVHADDGVIWGRRTADGVLQLSSAVFSHKLDYPSIAVELRAKTIQQGRVFGRGGELYLWREDAQYRCRLLTDKEMNMEGWEEQHLLWGVSSLEQEGFTLLEEGQRGFRHAVPLSVPHNQRAALTVRHYVEADDHGQAVVVLSRLVNLGLYAASKERR
jgi:CRISPR-associated protein (TIGR03984 family)